MLPVAEMPPFKFSSTWGEGDLLLSSAIRRGASFACDGRILRYRQKLEADVAGGLYSSLAPQPPPVVRENADFRVPVTHVKSVSVLKGPGTVWDSASQIWIHLDPPEGKHDRIQFDLGYFTNGDEIEKYCQCLPTLFPEIGEPESREGDSGFALING
jgi:hypothetical protein